MNSIPSTSTVIATRFILGGQVQGVGYRPAIARLARELGLSGWVRNMSNGVEAHIEGANIQVQQFADQCVEICPSNGKVSSMDARRVELESYSEFSIEGGSIELTLSTRLPKDLVVCPTCLEEVNNPSNRRFGYLLISCSQCGPRFTILSEMPYEREATSFNRFKLCDACRSEYESPTDRRFHAQTTGCAQCGPNLANLTQGSDYLRAGKIVCVKGIGGYQLLVSAHDSAAIERLRELKGRCEKPLAVMFPSQDFAEAICDLEPLEVELLGNSAAPIVVARNLRATLPDSVCRGLSSLGLMMPTTALHQWLTSEVGPLIVTSGNREGEPILFQDDATVEPLSQLADLLIDHDRPIQRPIDDSVVRVMGRQQVTLRLARGLAPLSLGIGNSGNWCGRHILAVGGHQKVAIALANGSQQVLGPHLGDMDSLATRQRFEDHVLDLTRLYQVAPEFIVHDRHDDYFTTRWSKDRASRNPIQTLAVQHHHAHVVAGMIEPQWLDRVVLGVAWDGTGLGPDGTIWGGEFLKATATECERVACLRPFLLPGGEAAIREPRRLAATLVREVQAWDRSVTCPFDNRASANLTLFHSLNSPITSSMGRLFDAVATLVLPQDLLRSGRADYEGHLAAMLESICDPDALGNYPMPICEARKIDFPGGIRLALPPTLDWRPMIRAILHDTLQNISPSAIAMRFHRTLALAIRQVSQHWPELPVVLGGGVFQNKILVDLVADDFANRSAPLAIPKMIPINDGGLAAGQLAIASRQLAKEQPCV